MAARRSGAIGGSGSSGNEHRHTVPNATYTSFPCYQEEVNIKTNVTKLDDSRSGSGTDGTGTEQDFQVNVSLQDKLRMCFQEMESLKGQFDQRRSRKLSAKKKALPSGLSSKPEMPSEPLYSTPHQSRASTSGLAPATGTTSRVRTIPPKITKSNFEFTADSAVAAKGVDDNKYKARLIRTSSKDSVDLLEQLKGDEGVRMFDIYSDSPGYEEIRYPANHPRPVPVEEPIYTKVYRRPLGDPTASGIPVAMRSASTSTNVRPESTGARMLSGSKLAKSTPDSLSVPKTADTRKSFDEWLEKLDEVNDISRSTLNRIKYLESEISNLKRATDKLQTKQNARITSKIPTGPSPPSSPKTSSVSATASAIVEKILKRPESRQTAATSGLADKKVNTDIDLLMMNQILKSWKDSQTAEAEFQYRKSSYQRPTYSPTKMDTQPQSTIQTHEQSSNIVVENSRRAKRRLTTTINRSIEIQTEVFQAEKSVATDPEPPQKSPIESAFKTAKEHPEVISHVEDVPILDLPNIETPTPDPYQQSQQRQSSYRQSTSTPMPTSASSRRSSRIANPIIEIYSDSDETSFDDFEKNIYNQISKRALIKNQMANRRLEEEGVEEKIYDQKDLDALRVKSSSTQTMAPEVKQQQQQYPSQTRPGTPEEDVESEQDSESPFQSAGFHEPPPETPVPPRHPSHQPMITAGPQHPPSGQPILRRNLQSSSTILIERVGANRKEQSEIVLKTNVDNDGVVHRTTEVKNRKFKPRASGTSSSKQPITSKVQSSQKTGSNYHYANERMLRKVSSDMNVRHSKNYIQRPVSAFDISGGNEDPYVAHSKNILGDKAFSTMDIPSKSPVISEGYHSEYLDSHPRVDTPTNHSGKFPGSSRYIVEPPMAYTVLPEMETNLDDDIVDVSDDHLEEGQRSRSQSPTRHSMRERSLGHHGNRQWEEISKSQVLNTMTNEALNRYGDIQLGKSSLMTFTNEMVIDTVGKETNITTKSRTIRKYAPLNVSADSGYHPASGQGRSKSTFDLSDEQHYQQAKGHHQQRRDSSSSQYDLYDRQLAPYDSPPGNAQLHPYDAHDQNSMIPVDEQPMACNFSLVYNCGNNVVIRANFGMAKLPLFETNL